MSAGHLSAVVGGCCATIISIRDGKRSPINETGESRKIASYWPFEAVALLPLSSE